MRHIMDTLRRGGLGRAPAPLQQFSFFLTEQQARQFDAELEIILHDGAARRVGAAQFSHRILDIAAQIGADILKSFFLLGGEGAGGGEIAAAHHQLDIAQRQVALFGIERAAEIGGRAGAFLQRHGGFHFAQRPVHEAVTEQLVVPMLQEPQGRLGEAFKAVTVAMRRLRGRQSQYRDGKLSYAQMSLLFGLDCQHAVSARDLAESVVLSPATVTQMLEALEAEGLVVRERSADDRRVVLTRLTDHGQELMGAHRSEMQTRWRATLGHFDDKQLDTAADVLSALAAMFENYESA